MNLREQAFARTLEHLVIKQASAATDFLGHTRAAASEFSQSVKRRNEMADAFGYRRFIPFTQEQRAWLLSTRNARQAKANMRASAKDARLAGAEALRSGDPVLHDAGLRTYRGADDLLSGRVSRRDFAAGGPSGPEKEPARGSMLPWVGGGAVLAGGGAYMLKRRRDKQNAAQNPYGPPPQ